MPSSLSQDIFTYPLTQRILCVFLPLSFSVPSLHSSPSLSLFVSPVSLSLTLSIYLHIHPSIYLTRIYIYTYKSIYLSIDLSVYPYRSLSLSLTLTPSLQLWHTGEEVTGFQEAPRVDCWASEARGAASMPGLFGFASWRYGMTHMPESSRTAFGDRHSMHLN